MKDDDFANKNARGIMDNFTRAFAFGARRDFCRRAAVASFEKVFWTIFDRAFLFYLYAKQKRLKGRFIFMQIIQKKKAEKSKKIRQKSKKNSKRVFTKRVLCGKLYAKLKTASKRGRCKISTALDKRAVYLRETGK